MLTGLLLIGCAEIHEKPSFNDPKYTIGSETTALKANLEKARTISLQTGESVVVRLPLRQTQKEIEDDRRLAEETIIKSYGKRYLLS